MYKLLHGLTANLPVCVQWESHIWNVLLRNSFEGSGAVTPKLVRARIPFHDLVACSHWWVSTICRSVIEDLFPGVRCSGCFVTLRRIRLCVSQKDAARHYWFSRSRRRHSRVIIILMFCLEPLLEMGHWWCWYGRTLPLCSELLSLFYQLKGELWWSWCLLINWIKDEMEYNRRLLLSLLAVNGNCWKRCLKILLMVLSTSLRLWCPLVVNTENAMDKKEKKTTGWIIDQTPKIMCSDSNNSHRFNEKDSSWVDVKLLNKNYYQIQFYVYMRFCFPLYLKPGMQLDKND